MLARRGDVGEEVVCTTFLLLSMFRHDYKVVMSLNQTITVSEWSCLVLMFCETAYVQHENSTASCECQARSQLSYQRCFLSFFNKVVISGLPQI